MILKDRDKRIILTLIESLNPSQFKGLTTKIKYLYPNIYLNLKNYQISNNIQTLSEVIYLVISNMDDIPDCSHLSNKCLGKLKFKSIIEGYHSYCKSCSSLSEDFISKRKETCIDKYGYQYPMQNKQILNKAINTLMIKYGVPNAKKIHE